MKRLFRVYVHTLKEDGRKYFGVTNQTLEERWRNGEGYKGCTRFYNAIKEYGWDAFYHDVVYVCTNQSEAYAQEEMFIKEYKANDERYGFNLQSGGENPTQSLCSIIATATKQKGKKVAGVALEHVREAARNRDNSVFAHPMAEETKKKISVSRKGIPCPERAKVRSKEVFSVPVRCVELNEVYPSMKDAADNFGLSKCTISAVIKGRNKTAGGYHWEIYNSNA